MFIGKFLAEEAISMDRFDPSNVAKVARNVLEGFAELY